MASQAVTQNWKELQGISQEDFDKDMKSGKFDSFLNDKEFLASFKSGKLFEKPEPAQPAAEPAAPPAAAPEQKVAQPWWQEQGYESEAEAVEKFKNMPDLLEKKQRQIDLFNAERGREGKENKERIKKLEAELQRYKTELETAKKTGEVIPSIEAPEAPVAPIPADGNFDNPEYVRAYGEYQAKVQEFNRKQKEYAKYVSEIGKRTHDVERDAREAKERAAASEAQAKADAQERQRQAAAKAWNDVMSEVNKLQEFDPALKTSKPFDEINNVIRSRGYEEAAKMYPKKDIENFDRLCEVIKEYHAVDTAGNVDFSVPPRHRSLKTAYYNKLDSEGKLDEFLINTRTQGERKGREQVLGALQAQRSQPVVLPAGASDKNIVDEVSEADLDSKLNEYMKPEYDSRYKNDPQFQAMMYDLMSKKAAKDPKFNALIPEGWKEKYGKPQGV